MESKTSKPQTTKILQNIGFFTLGRTLGDICIFALFVVLSRTYGQEGIGQYSFAIALTGFFVVLADFGIYDLSVKDMSRLGIKLNAYFGKVLITRLILATVAYIFLLTVSYILPFPHEIKLIIITIGAYQIIWGLIDVFATTYVSQNNMLAAGIIEFTLKAFAASAAIFAALLEKSLVYVLCVILIVSMIHLLAVYIAVIKKYGWPKFRFSWFNFSAYLKESAPYGLSEILRQLSARTDIIFLGFFLGMSAAGLFNAAYRIIFFVMIFSGFASYALLPVVAKMFFDSREKLIDFYNHSYNTAILLAIPAAAGIWLIAPKLIDLLYGQEFQESSELLKLLTLIVAFSFIRNIVGVFLTACDLQQQRLKAQWHAALINIIGNAILIPLFGIKGAIFATLLSEAFITIALTVRFKRISGWPIILNRLFISCVGSAIFCITFTYFQTIPIVLVIVGSIFIYILVLALFSDIRKKEFHIVLSFFHNIRSTN